MKFGAVPPREAEGAIAVHSIRKDVFTLKKGTLIGKPEIAALEAANIPDIVVARLEPGDVSEDIAAADIAAAVAGEGVHVDRAFTGRANLFAESAGVLVVDKAGVDALNDADPAITFATLEAYAPVVVGKMIATVKIIPFAVPGQAWVLPYRNSTSKGQTAVSAQHGLVSFTRSGYCLYTFPSFMTN